MPALLWLLMQLYLSAVALDGDYQSDWLTHLPIWYRAAIEHLGAWFAHTGDVTYWVGAYHQAGISFVLGGVQFVVSLPVY